MRVLGPFLLTVLFASCFGCSAAPAATSATSAATAKAPLPRPDAAGALTLAVGGQAEVAPGIVLTLENVVADSRCPVDVTCVWAGEVRVAFTVESEGRKESFELSTNSSPATARGLRFELLGVAPAPRSSVSISAADYRISLRVIPAAAGASR